MIRIYSLLLYVALPFALLRLLWRSRLAPAYRRRLGERLGLYGDRPMAAGLWIHAVSVGETQAAVPLIKHFLQRHPTEGVMVTTTTPTGSERLRALFEEGVHHVYMPFDLMPIVNRFLDRTRPRMALVMETEVWPNMLRACEHRGIPVLLANARLSARSAQRYARLGDLAGETFRRLSLVGAQSEADAGRFRALGVAAERLHVTGSIKFDLRLPASLRERAEVMRRAWGCDRPVWVAASTHEGEEEQVLEAHRHVMKALPRALLVLVPRHPERFERVAALASRKGFAPVRRSAGGQCRADDGLFLGDTMGELPVFIAAADAAFVGGSLVPAGGHNLLEAAAAGVPAAIGPHVFNFSQITELLVSEGAAVQVSDSRELAAQMTEWLGDAAIRAGVGENGRRVVERNRGAVNRVIDLLESCYPGQEDQ